jgi:hypothetical protein
MTIRSGRILERSLSEEVVFGRPPDYLKVFLSSRMHGGSLAAERRVAIEAIDASPLHRAWAWERDAHAGPYSAPTLCVANARTSDALVLILGEDLTTMTKKEFNAARRARVPSFILIKEGVARTPEAERFIGREQARVVTNTFANDAELRTQLQGALRAYAVRVHRVAAVEGL